MVKNVRKYSIILICIVFVLGAAGCRRRVVDTLQEDLSMQHSVQLDVPRPSETDQKTPRPVPEDVPDVDTVGVLPDATDENSQSGQFGNAQTPERKAESAQSYGNEPKEPESGLQSSAGDRAPDAEPPAGAGSTEAEPPAGDRVLDTEPSASAGSTEAEPTAGDRAPDTEPPAGAGSTDAEPPAEERVPDTEPSVGAGSTDTKSDAGTSSSDTESDAGTGSSDTKSDAGAGTSDAEPTAGEGASQQESGDETPTPEPGEEQEEDGMDREFGIVMDAWQQELWHRLTIYPCQYLSVYFETAQEYVTVNAAAPEAALIHDAAGENVGADLGDDLLRVDDAWIAKKNPALIVKCVGSGILGRDISDTSGAKAAWDAVRGREGIAQAEAVTSGNILVVSEELMDSPQGNLLLKYYIAHALHPELFEGVDLSVIQTELMGTEGIYVYPRIFSPVI